MDVKRSKAFLNLGMGNMTPPIYTGFVRVLLASVVMLINSVVKADVPEIVSLKKIWDGAPHNAFTDLIYHQGGPNFLRIPDGRMWCASRIDGRTKLARMTVNTFEPVLELPCDGDTGYPGMAWHDGLLWISYYSSHEGKTSIYLAKIRLDS
tara:strand:+ start:51 stop:503 length:453 start_codon:yes stop_codon:yes gene_type:complete